MLRSLIYVSRSRFDGQKASAEVDRIVAASNRHNPAMDVTGAIVFTGTHFAQTLEGSADALEILMARIASDARHDCVDVLRNTEIAERSFPDWAMAFSGPSTYLADHIRPLLDDDQAAPDAAERLITVMQEFRFALENSRAA
jgi:hypothetical protein